MILRAERAERNSLSVAIDLSALVKEDFHWVLTKDSQKELITHRVDILDCTAHDRAFPLWRGRQSGGTSPDGLPDTNAECASCSDCAPAIDTWVSATPPRLPLLRAAP